MLYHSVRTCAALICLAFGLTAHSVQAQDASTLVQAHLYAGTLAQGEVEFATLVSRSPDDQTARFGLGAIQFLRAVETLAQSLYRHGLEAPRSVMLPILRMPVPSNPRPEPLTYSGFRDILSRLASDLGKAEATLAQVKGESARLSIDLMRVHLDLDVNGQITEDANLWTILGGVDPQVARSDQRRHESEVATFPVTFDAGDVAWLRAYAHQSPSLPPAHTGPSGGPIAGRHDSQAGKWCNRDNRALQLCNAGPLAVERAGSGKLMALRLISSSADRARRAFSLWNAPGSFGERGALNAGYRACAGTTCSSPRASRSTSAWRSSS